MRKSSDEMNVSPVAVQRNRVDVVRVRVGENASRRRRHHRLLRRQLGHHQLAVAARRRAIH